MTSPSPGWGNVLATVIDRSHVATGEQLPDIVHDAVRPLGLTVDVLLVDLAEQVLTQVGPESAGEINVVGTLPGRAYQTGELIAGADAAGRRLIWVPMQDGAERAGLLRVGLGDGVVDSAELRRKLWSLAGLMSYLVLAKLAYSDRLRRLRSRVPLSSASELLWQLLPPRTFATERVVVSALLQRHHQVAGDAYEYNVDRQMVDLAVFDAAGHDLHASLTTSLAITAIRNARRAGETDLIALAALADDLIAALPGPPQFVTAVLARLDTVSGILEYLIAGHPPPLLVRGGRVVKELAQPPRLPLGVRANAGNVPNVSREQLEPGDRVLIYSDGVTEARDAQGEFFGEQRLVELTEHAAADHLPAPETLRRLGAAVLDHQGGDLQDDATLLLADWSEDAHSRMFPTLPGGE